MSDTLAGTFDGTNQAIAKIPSVANHKLSALEVERAKPESKPRKLVDGAGLYLLVHPNGSKYWRYDYRYKGKRKTLALGIHPEVSLSKARINHKKARDDIRDGNDPSYLRQVSKLTHGFGETFADTASEWLEKKRKTWTHGHTRTVEGRLNNDLLPKIGARPITEIKPVEVLAVLRAIEKRGANETAHRVRIVASQVFRYGVATGRVESDPCRDLSDALQAVESKPLAHITDPERLGELLRASDLFTGNDTVKLALALAPHVFLRPGELRGALWQEIKLDKAMWTIPAERMKGRQRHYVPLSKQVIEILNEARELNQESKLVFPSPTNSKKSITDVSMNGALRRIGFGADEMTMHGFRHTASTLLNEQRDYDADLIESQLAHTVGSDVRRTYNQAKWLKQRAEMMQDWSDYLAQLSSKNWILA